MGQDVSVNGPWWPNTYRKKYLIYLHLFFLDTPQIRIQDVSNEYRYQIRIQVSDTLWVEVSMGKLTKSSCTSDCSLQTIPSKINWSNEKRRLAGILLYFWRNIWKEWNRRIIDNVQWNEFQVATTAKEDIDLFWLANSMSRLPWLPGQCRPVLSLCSSVHLEFCFCPWGLIAAGFFCLVTRLLLGLYGV
jgi:hypothetical protein